MQRSKRLDCFTSWRDFYEVIIRRFGGVQAKARARVSLLTIEQGNLSLKRYGSKFLELLEEVVEPGEDDGLYIYQFFVGLSRYLRGAYASRPTLLNFTTVREVIDLAVPGRVHTWNRSCAREPAHS